MQIHEGRFFDSAPGIIRVYHAIWNPLPVSSHTYPGILPQEYASTIRGLYPVLQRNPTIHKHVPHTHSQAHRIQIGCPGCNRFRIKYCDIRNHARYKGPPVPDTQRLRCLGRHTPYGFFRGADLLFPCQAEELRNGTI